MKRGLEMPTGAKYRPRIICDSSAGPVDIQIVLVIYVAAHHLAGGNQTSKEEKMSSTGNTTKSAFPMLDIMLEMQQAGMRAMSMYQPVVSAFMDSTKAVERAARPAGFSATSSRTQDARPSHDADEEQIIAIGEEVLNVGTRMVSGKTTRVRRVVVESPVQQDVTLHNETVVLERRRPLVSTGQDVLTEVTIEMSDASEVPVVSKAVHLVEEVLLRKEVTSRIETIRETVKRDKLEIDQPSQLPVVFNAAQKQEEKKRAADNHDKKQTLVPTQGENKAGDHKRQ